MNNKTRRKSKRHSRQKKNCRKTMRGGSGLYSLSPALIDQPDQNRISFKNPSPNLERSVPYTPPRPGAPSPPPPLGMTSGPAFGLKIPGPPMLAGDENMSGGGCKCKKGGKKSRKRKSKRKSKSKRERRY